MKRRAIGELQDRLKWNLLGGLSNEYRDDRVTRFKDEVATRSV